MAYALLRGLELGEGGARMLISEHDDEYLMPFLFDWIAGTSTLISSRGLYIPNKMLYVPTGERKRALSRLCCGLAYKKGHNHRTYTLRAFIRSLQYSQRSQFTIIWLHSGLRFLLVKGPHAFRALRLQRPRCACSKLMEKRTVLR
jgi:hypothetical protein